MGLTVLSADSSLINANIVNYSIIVDGYEITRDFDNFILSYEDRTYISIRDVAKCFNKNVRWDGKYEMIYITNQRPEKEIVNLWDTALTIGKAIINEHFPNRITESIQYAGIQEHADHIGARKTFFVYVTFETDNDFDLQNSLDNFTNIKDFEKLADVRVTIYCDNGETSFKELR